MPETSIDDLKKQADAAKVEALNDLEKAQNSQELYDVKVRFLGKNGHLSQAMREMKNLSPADRPQFGQVVNVIKETFESAYLARERTLKTGELKARLEREKLDMTLPGPTVFRGSRHPVSLVIEEMTSIFARLGYSVRTGPLIEKDRYNFEALNIPKDHPARDMQDTFYIDETYVLRTQTSPIQIHSLEKEQLPLKVIGPGAVFRKDYDITHLPMFHQIEGMLVDRKVSMGDLKGTLAFFGREFFGKELKMRLRPSFFPFTEPSAEVDCSCPQCSGKGCRVCGHSGWLEMAGCGLVHPNVFETSGKSSKEWQGFAFGFGVERLAMVKYAIEDIRLLVENDTRFLRQFPS